MAVFRISNGVDFDFGIPKIFDGTAFTGNTMKFFDGVAWVGFETLIVSPSAANISVGGSDATVIAGLEIRNLGTEVSTNSAGSYVISRGFWIDLGDPADVWVERTLVSGTLTVDPGAGRLNLATTRQYEKHDTSFLGGPTTCTVKFDYYNAATGGDLLDSVTIIFTADKEMGG